MSLVSGPGRGGSRSNDLPGELMLHVDKHVEYIQSLDSVWLTASLLSVYNLLTTVLKAERRT